MGKALPQGSERERDSPLRCCSLYKLLSKSDEAAIGGGAFGAEDRISWLLFFNSWAEFSPLPELPLDEAN